MHTPTICDCSIASLLRYGCTVVPTADVGRRMIIPRLPQHNFDRNLRVGRFLVASNVCSTSQERRLAQAIEHELNGESGQQYARHATDHISTGAAEDSDQMLGRSHRAKC